MIRRTFISFLVIFATFVAAIGQTSVEISLPRNARVGARFTITVTVNNPDGNVTAPQMPDLDGCTFVGGPGTSTSSSVSIINGSVQRSETRSYSYTYQGAKECEVKVPSIAVTVNGKSYTTQPGSFTIGAGTASASSSQSSGGNSNGKAAAKAGGDFEISENELFMTVGLTNNNVYEQQAVEVIIKLYSTNMQVDGLQTSTLPTFDGCLIESLGMPQSIDWKSETYNGRSIYSAVVYRALLYPQRAGKITLNGGEYTAQAYRQTYVQDFFGYRPMLEHRDVKLVPRTATLTVKPLPEPRPADFSGAVGKFNVSAKLVGDKFKTNEASTIIYTIEGTGNIKFLTAPTVDFPSEFEVYEPSVSSSTRVSGYDMTGTQTVEYTFVPRSVGRFEIGEYNFVYFNPSSGQYVSEQCPGYEIDVAQGVDVNPSSSVGKQDVKAKNTDIHHIRVGADAPGVDPGFMVQRAWYILAYILLLAVVVALSYIYNRKQQADPDGRRLNRAGKVARKRLAKAGKLLQAKQYEGYYEELLRAMQSYLSDKLQIPASQMSRDSVMSALTSRSASEELQQRLTEILNDCEMARYTPQLSADAAEQTYSAARNVIDEIERLKS